jgi:hypothetical protein
MRIPNWYFGEILKELEWRCSKREKSTIPGHFLEILENFRGGKGTPDIQSIKKY